jgi:hypothetical protein
MTNRFFARTGSLLAGAWKRLVRARVWMAAQFVGVALLIVAGLAWTRIPEKHAGQVLLTMLMPILIAAGFMLLQSGTMRSMLRRLTAESLPESTRVMLIWGATTLLLWIALGWLFWIQVDRFDDRIFAWSGYLNSRFGAHARSHFATFEHFVVWLGWAAWLLRWVFVPGLMLPLACSASFGLRRMPWKRVAAVWLDWRWWPAVLVLALVGQAWPVAFFDGMPHGTVHAQVWRAIFKVFSAYILAVGCWVVSLAWVATLLAGLRSGDDELEGVPEPVLLSPQGGRRESVRLPLPEAEENLGR